MDAIGAAQDADAAPSDDSRRYNDGQNNDGQMSPSGGPLPGDVRERTASDESRPGGNHSRHGDNADTDGWGSWGEEVPLSEALPGAPQNLVPGARLFESRARCTPFFISCQVHAFLNIVLSAGLLPHSA